MSTRQALTGKGFFDFWEREVLPSFCWAAEAAACSGAAGTGTGVVEMSTNYSIVRAEETEDFWEPSPQAVQRSQ